MSDHILVEFDVDLRLRDSENAGPTRSERRMADEIARLRAEVTSLTAQCESYRESFAGAVQVNDNLRAENAKLREALTNCADDLECEINADYPESVRVYPVMQAKYERDMTTVYEARAALKDTQP